MSPVDLFGSHPNKLIHTLQAHILLAYYFLRTGSLLEAKCRAGTAVSLALGAGSPQDSFRTCGCPFSFGVSSKTQPFVLPSPTDSLQEAERINGFWTVLALHKFITVALESPITSLRGARSTRNADRYSVACRHGQFRRSESHRFHDHCRLTQRFRVLFRPT